MQPSVGRQRRARRLPVASSGFLPGKGAGNQDTGNLSPARAAGTEAQPHHAPGPEPRSPCSSGLVVVGSFPGKPCPQWRPAGLRPSPGGEGHPGPRDHLGKVAGARTGGRGADKGGWSKPRMGSEDSRREVKAERKGVRSGCRLLRWAVEGESVTNEGDSFIHATWGARSRRQAP